MKPGCFKDTDLQRPDQDVVRLEVTEDDVLPVEVCQAHSHLIGHLKGQHVAERHVAAA